MPRDGGSAPEAGWECGGFDLLGIVRHIDWSCEEEMEIGL